MVAFTTISTWCVRNQQSALAVR